MLFRIKHFTLLFLILCFALVKAQETATYKLSLNEAIDFAIANNIKSKKAKLDRGNAFQKVNEVRAESLPQIDGSIQYNYYAKQPVTVIPANFNDSLANPDEFTEAIFGARQNMTAGVTLRQLIFSGTYFVAIKSAIAFERTYELLEEKTKSDLKADVVDHYGTVLVAQENVKILEKNLEIAKANFREISEIYKVGLAEEQDVEQLNLSVKELQSTLNSAKRSVEIAMLGTKFLLGLDLDAKILLTTNFEDLVDPDFLLSKDGEINYDIKENINYRISLNQLRISELNVKNEKSRALPQMGVFASYNFQRFSDDFPIFNSAETNWNPFSLLGFQIDIPIFGSFKLKSRINQATNSYKIAELETENNLKSIKLDIERKTINYKNSLDNFQLTKEALALSESIYKKEYIKFQEGISTSSDLRSIEKQKYQADANYIQISLQVIKSKNELFKSAGKY